jgi:hypothetical protein
MPDKITRAERRAQHTFEVKASQAKLRTSIAETERLVGESEQMLRRHRDECDADELRRGEASRQASAKP